jgi:hypothetical protein
VVLSTRDESSWIASMERTIWQYCKGFLEQRNNGVKPEDLPPFGRFAIKFSHHLLGDDFETNGRKLFREHNELVRRACRERERPLLEYDVKQGWKPLCEFLGVDVPEGPLPRADEFDEMVEKAKAGVTC